MPKGYRKDGTPIIPGKKKEEAPPQDNRMGELEEKVNRISSLLERILEQKEEKKEEKETPKIYTDNPVISEDKVTVEIISGGVAYKTRIPSDRKVVPVPEDWIKAVHEILNEEFGVVCFGRSDVPVTDFNIVVPKKYSPLKEDEWQYRKADLRCKAVSYAEGAVGARAYAKRVFDSFPQETKVMIKQDAVKYAT